MITAADALASTNASTATAAIVITGAAIRCAFASALKKGGEGTSENQSARQEHHHGSHDREAEDWRGDHPGLHQRTEESEEKHGDEHPIADHDFLSARSHGGEPVHFSHMCSTARREPRPTAMTNVIAKAPAAMKNAPMTIVGATCN